MSDNIVVALRLRPLIKRELSEQSLIHWETENKNIIQIDPETKKQISSFGFDDVFDGNHGNLQVYNTLAYPIVQASLTGINGTIFAYGQTSSGKTYTMTGTSQLPGIIPLSIQSIFQSIENTPDREFLLRASYMEIYQESIYDLLTGGKIPSVREDTAGQVIVPGLKEICVINEESLLGVMSDGDKRRKVGETNMNERSSRSHSIFRLIIESREREDKDCEGAVTVSHLNLVDLAGSENASQTGAIGERLKEGGSINKSLFMLGRVISQLSDGEQFVNFRDSKLTRILQNSLGGNTKTVIVCTVTSVSREQTLSTVRFASRAKSIKNKPIINEVLSESALLKRYAMEIKKLKTALEKERKTDKAQEVEEVKEKLDEQEKKNLELQEKLKSLKEKLVVSSHPSEIGIPKDIKKRRKTWAASAFRKPRISMFNPSPVKGISSLNSILQITIEESPLSNITEETTPSTTDGSDLINDSVASFESNAEYKEELFKMNELSKLEGLEDSFLSPQMVPKRRKRKHVNFEDFLPKVFVDNQSQTDEDLLPKPPLLVSNFETPTKMKSSKNFVSPGSTPKEVLRLKIFQMKEKLERESLVVSDWKKELQDLDEFQQAELTRLGDVYEEKNKELEEEIESLRKSFKESESLFLTANKTVWEQTNEIRTLKETITSLSSRNQELSGAVDERDNLTATVAALKMELIKKDNKIETLEKNVLDFDMRMELGLEKQKQTESYLRGNLNDAWEEIAKYEGCSKSLVEERTDKIVRLQGELENMKTELDAALKEKELLKAEFVEVDVKNSIRALNKNYEIMDGDEKSPLEQSCMMNMSVALTHTEVSRKLSETLQLFNESLLGDNALLPEKDLVFDSLEIMTIKEQLISLQEMLTVAQSFPLDLVKSCSKNQDKIKDCCIDSEITNDYTKETEAIILLENVSIDYLNFVIPLIDDKDKIAINDVLDSLDENLKVNNDEQSSMKSVHIIYKEYVDKETNTEFNLFEDKATDALITKGKDRLNSVCVTPKGYANKVNTELKMYEDNETEVNVSNEELNITFRSSNSINKDCNLNKTNELYYLNEDLTLSDMSLTSAVASHMKYNDSNIYNLADELKMADSSFDTTKCEDINSSLKNIREESEKNLKKLIKDFETKEEFYKIKIKELECRCSELEDKSISNSKSTIMNLTKEQENQNIAEEKSFDNELIKEEIDSTTELNHSKFEQNFKINEDKSFISVLKNQNETLILESSENVGDSSSRIDETYVLSLKSKIDVQEKLIESLEDELNERRDKEEELELMITEFTLKEEIIEEKEMEIMEKERLIKEEMQDKSNIIRNLETQIKNIETELNILRPSADNCQIIVKEQILNCTRPLEEVENEIEISEDLKLKLDEKDNYIKLLHGKINASEEKRHELDNETSHVIQLENILSKFEELKQKYNAKENTEITLCEQIQCLKDELSENDMKLKALSDRLDIYLKENNEQSTDNSSLKSKLMNAEALLKTLEISNINDAELLLGRISSLNNELEEKNKDNYQIIAKEQILNCTKPQEEVENEIEISEDLKHKLDEKDNYIKLLHGKINASEEKRHELDNETSHVIQLENILSKFEELKQKYNAKENTEITLREQIQCLKDELSENDLKLKALSDRLDVYLKENNEQSTDNSSLKSKLMNAEALLKTLEISNINDAELLLGRISSLNNELEEKNKDNYQIIAKEQILNCTKPQEEVENEIEISEDLKHKLDEKDNYIKLLHGKINASEEKRHELDNETSHVIQLENILSKFEELKQKYNAKENTEITLREQIQCLKDELSENDLKLKALSDRLDVYLKENNEQSTDNSSLKSKLMNAEALLKTLEISNINDAELLLGRISSLNNELEEKNKECKEIILQMKNYENLKCKEINELKSEIEISLEQEQKYEKEMELKNNVMDSLNSDIINLKGECKHYCDKIKYLEKLLNDQKGIITVNSNSEYQELNSLGILLEQKESENKKIKTDYENLKLVLQKTTTEYEKEKVCNHNEIYNIKKSFEMKEMELEEALEKIKCLQDQINRMELNIQSIEHKTQRKKDQIQEFEEVLTARISELNDKNINIIALEDKLEDMKKDSSSLKVAYENVLLEKRSLTKKLENKEKELSEVISESDALKSYIDTLQISELKEKNINIIALEDKLEDMKKDSSSLKVAYENVLLEKKSLTKKLENKEKDLSEVISESDALKSDIDTLQIDKSNLLEALQETQEALEEHIELQNSKDVVIKKLEQDLCESQHVHEECEERELKSTTEIEKFILMVEKYEVEISEKDESYDKLLNQSNEMKLKLDEFKVRIEKEVSFQKNLIENEKKMKETLIMKESECNKRLSQKEIELKDIFEEKENERKLFEQKEKELKEILIEKENNLKQSLLQIHEKRIINEETEITKILCQKENELKVWINKEKEYQNMLANKEKEIISMKNDLETKIQKSEAKEIQNLLTENERLKIELKNSVERLNMLIREQDKSLNKIMDERGLLQEGNWTKLQLKTKEQKLETQENELERLKKIVKLLQDEKNKLSSTLIRFEDKNVTKDSESEISSREMDQLRKEILSLKEKNEKMMINLEFMKGELSEKDNNYNTLSNEYDQAIIHFKTKITDLEEFTNEEIESLKLENKKLKDIINICKKNIKDNSINTAGSLSSDSLKVESFNITESSSLQTQIEELKKANFSLINDIKVLKNEKETLKEQLEEKTTMLHTLQNSSIAPTPSSSLTQNSSRSSSKRKVIEENEKLYNKVYDLEEEIENLRRKDGIIGSNEELEKQLQFMRNEISKTESLNKMLNSNYDLLEIKISEFKKKNEILEKKSAEHKEKNSKTHTQNGRDTNKECEFSKEEFCVLKRENNIMKMKLEGLNTPAIIQVKKLKAELKMEQEKSKKIMQELRRIQNENATDTSIMALNLLPKEEKFNREIGSGFGSKIVLDVEIMTLKNINYHLEKDRDKLKSEVETLKSHVSHYKRKSDEWKTKYYKEIINVTSKVKEEKYNPVVGQILSKDASSSDVLKATDSPIIGDSQCDKNKDSHAANVLLLKDENRENEDKSAISNRKLNVNSTNLNVPRSDKGFNSIKDSSHLTARQFHKSQTNSVGKENKYSSYRSDKENAEGDCKTQ